MSNLKELAKKLYLTPGRFTELTEGEEFHSKVTLNPGYIERFTPKQTLNSRFYTYPAYFVYRVENKAEGASTREARSYYFHASINCYNKKPAKFEMKLQICPLHERVIRYTTFSFDRKERIIDLREYEVRLMEKITYRIAEEKVQEIQEKEIGMKEKIMDKVFGFRYQPAQKTVIKKKKEKKKEIQWETSPPLIFYHKDKSSIGIDWESVFERMNYVVHGVRNIILETENMPSSCKDYLLESLDFIENDNVDELLSDILSYIKVQYLTI
jgi:hypothetical protein